MIILFRLAHIFLALVSGVLVVGYGGIDDSPGAQGIGLLTIILGLGLCVVMYREVRHYRKQ